MTHTMIPDPCLNHPSVRGTIATFSPGIPGAATLFKVGCAACGMPPMPRIVPLETEKGKPPTFGMSGGRGWETTADKATLAWNSLQKVAAGPAA